VSGVRAFAASFANRNILVRFIARAFFCCVLFLGLSLAMLLRRDPHAIAGFHYLIESPVQVPVLYLYSKDDELGDYRFIEDFVARHRQQGAQVTAHCMQGRSAHVAHFYHHKDQYVAQINKFLQELD